MKKILFIAIVALSLNSCQKYVYTCFEHYSDTYDTITPIFFTSQCSSFANRYDWDFGDSTEVFDYTSDTITHKYKKPGVYTVKLTGRYYQSAPDQGYDGTKEGSITLVEKTITIN